MEDPPQVNIAQQLKAMMQTSQQSKQKLAQMTSVLDTQITATAKPTTDTQVTTAVTQVCDDQARAKAKPTKKQKIHVTASQTPTIDVIDCDTKEEVHSSMHAIEEVTEHSQTVIDFFNNNEMEDSIPNPRILESTSVSISPTLAFHL